MVLSPYRLSPGTRIRHPVESRKSLQAQHRSSQKKTASTGLHPNFLAFRNQSVVESHTLSHFSTEDSLMDVIYCSRTVFGEGKTNSGIFQFSGFRLKGTMRYITKKRCAGQGKSLFLGWIWEHYAAKKRVCFLFPCFRLSLGAGGSLYLLESKEKISSEHRDYLRSV